MRSRSSNRRTRRRWSISAAHCWHATARASTAAPRPCSKARWRCEPNNPTALFYGGIAALNRGNIELAADRWEILLGLNPPPEIRGVIEQRVAEWRGTAPPAGRQPPPTVRRTGRHDRERRHQPVGGGARIRCRSRRRYSSSRAIRRSRRRRLRWRGAACPSCPSWSRSSDSDAMIPGRPLSAFAGIRNRCARFRVRAADRTVGRLVCIRNRQAGRQARASRCMIDQQLP